MLPHHVSLHSTHDGKLQFVTHHSDVLQIHPEDPGYSIVVLYYQDPVNLLIQDRFRAQIFSIVKYLVGQWIHLKIPIQELSAQSCHDYFFASRHPESTVSVISDGQIQLKDDPTIGQIIQRMLFQSIVDVPKRDKTKPLFQWPVILLLPYDRRYQENLFFYKKLVSCLRHRGMRNRYTDIRPRLYLRQ